MISERLMWLPPDNWSLTSGQKRFYELREDLIALLNMVGPAAISTRGTYRTVESVIERALEELDRMKGELENDY